MIGLNRLVLVGQVANEPQHYEYESKDGEPRVSTHLRLMVPSPYSKRVTYVICRMYGVRSALARRLDLRRGQFIALHGELRVSSFAGSDGQKRTVSYAHVDYWTLLFDKPKTFVRGHKLVPIDEARKLDALNEGDLSWAVPGQVLESLDIDLPEGMMDDDGAQPDE